MEVSYRKHLYLPAAMEVHPVNDQAHGKMEQWAPDSEKMQAELEGNRMSKSLNVSPAQASRMQLQLSSWPAPALQTASSTSVCVHHMQHDCREQSLTHLACHTANALLGSPCKTC